MTSTLKVSDINSAIARLNKYENAGSRYMLQKLFELVRDNVDYTVVVHKHKFQHPGSPLPSNFYTWELKNPVSHQVFGEYKITRNIIPTSDNSPKGREFKKFLVDCFEQIGG